MAASSQTSAAAGQVASGMTGVTQRRPISAPSVAFGQRTRILYIEDVASNANLVARILEDRPHIDVRRAVNGYHGLMQALTDRPALVLLDLHLPDISGEEVLRRLKERALTSDIPVIVLTADDSPGRRETLLSNGASAFLAKPFELDVLLHAVDAFLAPTEVPV